jgi:hypothetical protein
MSIRHCEIEPVLEGHGGYPHLSISGTTVGQNVHIHGINGAEPAMFRVKSDVESFVGCVVLIRNRVERIMSDVWDDVTYAVVWDAEATAFREVHVRCSEFSGHWRACVATVDGTPEVFELYEAHLVGDLFRKKLDAYDREVYARLVEAATIRNGRKVRVVRGRKIPQGTEGIVFYQKEGRWGTQLGIRTSDRREGRNWLDAVWVSQDNCAVVGPRGNILSV